MDVSDWTYDFWFWIVWTAFMYLDIRLGLWFLRSFKHHPGLWQSGYSVSPVLEPTDLCDHSYSPLPLTDLTTHMYERHFEIWNSLGAKDPAPATWRREHDIEHGRR